MQSDRQRPLDHTHGTTPRAPSSPHERESAWTATLLREWHWLPAGADMTDGSSLDAHAALHAERRVPGRRKEHRPWR